jgi:hypothetical protein
VKRKTVIARPPSSMYERIRKILDSARSNVARSVNTTQVIANWLIGREIVEEEQKGMSRAGYGEELILDLSARLTSDYGKGYSKDNLFWFRRFYQGYPKLVDLKFDAVRQISDAPPRKSMTQAPGDALPPILHAPRGELRTKGHAVRSLSPDRTAARGQNAVRSNEDGKSKMNPHGDWDGPRPFSIELAHPLRYPGSFEGMIICERFWK